MPKGIILHDKYGLNPTMSECIICHKPTGEIALLGAGYKGEAPKNMVTSIVPCKSCKKKYLKEGVMLINPKTGSLAVIKTSAYKRIFDKPIPPKHIAYADEEVIQKFIK